MKKKFDSSTAVSRRVRKAFQEGFTIENEQKVIDLINEIKNEYEMTPELILYLINRINAFALNAEFKKHKDVQWYPVINALDTESIAAKVGYPNIFKTVFDNLVERSYKFETNNHVKQASLFLKAASKNTKVKHKAIYDSPDTIISKYSKYSNLSNFPLLESLNNRQTKVLNNIIEASRRSPIKKKADFTVFSNMISEIKKLKLSNIKVAAKKEVDTTTEFMTIHEKNSSFNELWNKFAVACGVPKRDGSGSRKGLNRKGFGFGSRLGLRRDRSKNVNYRIMEPRIAKYEKEWRIVGRNDTQILGHYKDYDSANKALKELKAKIKKLSEPKKTTKTKENKTSNFKFDELFKKLSGE